MKLALSCAVRSKKKSNYVSGKMCIKTKEICGMMCLGYSQWSISFDYFSKLPQWINETTFTVLVSFLYFILKVR